MVTIFISLFCKYIIYTLFLILVGKICMQYAKLESYFNNQYLSISTAYFLGSVTTFSIIRSLELLTHSFIYAVILFIILILFLAYKQIKNLQLFTKQVFLYIIIFISIFIILLFFWSTGSIKELGPMAYIGSLHSPRYVNIMEFIIMKDSIPILGQNYVQSVMATIPILLGKKYQYLSLLMLLTTTMIFLIYFIIGISIKLKFNIIQAICISLISIFITTTISPSHVIITDSYFPWFINGYSDVLIGVVSLSIIILLLIENFEILKNKYFIIIFILHIIFFRASAIQNFYFLFIFLCIKLWKNKEIFHYLLNKKIKITIITFIVLTILLFSGGMLTPNSKINREIPGMMSMMSLTKSEEGIKIRPNFMTLKFSFDSLNTRTIHSYPNYKNKIFKNINSKIINSLINKGATTIWFFFIPFALFLYIRKSKNNYNEHFKEFSNIGFYFLISGLLIYLLFMINGRKWELSRFLLPGLFIYTLCLPTILFRNTNKYLKILIISFIIINIYMNVNFIKNNIFSNFKNTHFQETFQTIFSIQKGYINEPL